MIDGEDDTLNGAPEIDETDIDAGGPDEQQQTAPEADDGELQIEIEGEEEPEETPLIKKLRTELRESQKREAEARKAVAPAEIVVGKEPDLWDDCEGDPDKYKAELLAWTKRSEQAEQQKRAQAEQGQISQQAFARAHAIYEAKKTTLGVKDFKESEDAVCAALPQVIQSAIVQYAQDPAKLVYALGRHPAKLAEIAAETDPVRQILMLHDLEKKVVAKRKSPPPPEADTIQRGSAPIMGSDKTLERLEKEAARTGDRTKLIAYKSTKN